MVDFSQEQRQGDLAIRLSEQEDGSQQVAVLYDGPLRNIEAIVRVFYNCGIDGRTIVLSEVLTTPIVHGMWCLVGRRQPVEPVSSVRSVRVNLLATMQTVEFGER